MIWLHFVVRGAKPNARNESNQHSGFFGTRGRRGRRGRLRRQSDRRSAAEIASAMLHLQTCQQFHIAELHSRRRGAIARVSHGVFLTPITSKFISCRSLFADAISHRARAILWEGTELGALANLIDIVLRN